MPNFSKTLQAHINRNMRIAIRKFVEEALKNIPIRSGMLRGAFTELEDLVGAKGEFVSDVRRAERALKKKVGVLAKKATKDFNEQEKTKIKSLTEKIEEIDQKLYRLYPHYKKLKGTAAKGQKYLGGAIHQLETKKSYLITERQAIFGMRKLEIEGKKIRFERKAFEFAERLLSGQGLTSKESQKPVLRKLFKYAKEFHERRLKYAKGFEPLPKKDPEDLEEKTRYRRKPTEAEKNKPAFAKVFEEFRKKSFEKLKGGTPRRRLFFGNQFGVEYYYPIVGNRKARFIKSPTAAIEHGLVTPKHEIFSSDITQEPTQDVSIGGEESAITIRGEANPKDLIIKFHFGINITYFNINEIYAGHAPTAPWQAFSKGKQAAIDYLKQAINQMPKVQEFIVRIGIAVDKEGNIHHEKPQPLITRRTPLPPL